MVVMGMIQKRKSRTMKAKTISWRACRVLGESVMFAQTISRGSGAKHVVVGY